MRTKEDILKVLEDVHSKIASLKIDDSELKKYFEIAVSLNEIKSNIRYLDQSQEPKQTDEIHYVVKVTDEINLKELKKVGLPDILAVRGNPASKGYFITVDNKFTLPKSSCFILNLSDKIEPKQREVSEAVDVDWDKLREKFFLDCVDTTYVNKYTPSLRKVNYAPHDLFEWFKDNLFKSKNK